MAKARKPGRPRDEGRAARRREQILRCAIDHFAKRGYTGADLEAVAAEAGVAKGTIYLYFASKGELFAAAVDEVMLGLLEATNGSHIADPVERLKHGIRAFLTYFDKNPRFVELLVLERAEFRDRERPTYHLHKAAHKKRLKQTFAALMREGVFRKAPVDRTIETIGDLLYGTIFMDYFSGRKRRLEHRVNDVLDLVLLGVLSRESPPERRKRQGKRT